MFPIWIIFKRNFYLWQLEVEKTSILQPNIGILADHEKEWNYLFFFFKGNTWSERQVLKVSMVVQKVALFPLVSLNASAVFSDRAAQLSFNEVIWIPSTSFNSYDKNNGKIKCILMLFLLFSNMCEVISYSNSSYVSYLLLCAL